MTVSVLSTLELTLFGSPPTASPIHGFAFYGQVVHSQQVWKQIIILRTYHQVSRSLIVCHHSYVIRLTKSHHVGILLSHTITRRV